MNAVLDRPSFDQCAILMAMVARLRSTCSRRYVGAALMQGTHIIATGYNGASSGLRHCDHTNGGDLENNHCSQSSHAEDNVYGFAARFGISTDGSTLATTEPPCYQCALKRVIPGGTKRVIFTGDYNEDPRVATLFKDIGIEMQRVDVPGYVVGKFVNLEEGEFKQWS